MEKNKTWFVLGREPEISAAEIIAVLKLTDNSISFISDNILIANTTVDEELIKRLGGTIKIANEIGTGLKEKELKEQIINELKTITGKIHFGISLYDKSGQIGVKALALEIKKKLKGEGLSVRYVPSDKNNQLSSAVVFHNQLTTKGREFLIVKDDNGLSLAKTISIQPFEELGMRDFGRPGRDDYSGMLPPKLAMMMINLSQTDLGDTLLDPFCGSGTILSEAILMGYRRLIGTDISKKAVDDTLKNINWMKSNSNFKFQPQELQLKQCDIAEIYKIVANNSVDAIVTEPFLGKPLTGHEAATELKKQTDELKLLYLNAFKVFAKLLKKNGVSIFIIPRFFYNDSWITINCESEIEKYGFKTIPLRKKQPYLLYGRPGQRVGREIWKFKKL